MIASERPCVMTSERVPSEKLHVAEEESPGRVINPDESGQPMASRDVADGSKKEKRD